MSEQPISEKQRWETRFRAPEYIFGKALNAFLQMRENNRYVRGMFSWVGFRQTGVPYTREERHSGASHYTLSVSPDGRALYAVNRLVDNVSDEPGDIESKRRGLARWRALLDEVFGPEMTSAS